MITGITPYLNFDRCEEALNYYVKTLGAEIKSMMRVSDGPKEYQSPENNDKIMHAMITIGNATVLASDAMGQDIAAGKNVSLSLNFDDAAQCQKAWDNMKDGSKVIMELQATFWAPLFGMLQDQYGINWMFNCDKK